MYYYTQWPTCKIFASHPITAILSSAVLEVLVSKERMIPPREAYKSELNVKTAIFISSCHWTNRQNVGNSLTGMFDLNQQGAMWQTMRQESLCLHPRNYLGMPLTFLCPIIKLIGILEQYWQDIQGVVSPQERRIDSFFIQKRTRLAEVLREHGSVLRHSEGGKLEISIMVLWLVTVIDFIC